MPAIKDPQRSFLLPLPDQTLTSGLGFLRHARFRLSRDYRVKIERALETLDDAQIWRRLHADGNSIGNLLLHLEGNLRQWMVAGVGSGIDRRNRPREFAAVDGATKEALIVGLAATLEEADAVLAGIEEKVQAEGNESALQQVIEPQGYRQTVLDAVFHAVEHFSYHTGQIVLLAKWLRGEGMGFYDDGELAQSNQEKIPESSSENRLFKPAKQATE